LRSDADYGTHLHKVSPAQAVARPYIFNLTSGSLE
jgi:hypothetical protein